MQHEEHDEIEVGSNVIPFPSKNLCKRVMNCPGSVPALKFMPLQPERENEKPVT